MSRRSFRLVLAAMVVWALFASACGDDETTNRSGPETTGVLRFQPFDAGGPLTKAALRSGEVDVAVLFTTDADIAIEDWVLLEDDRLLQPAENLIPAIRADVATPQIEEALDTISAALTTEGLTELNRQQSQDLQDSDVIARRWLEANDLLPYEGRRITGRLRVGSTNFAEQEIVAEIYAQVLESAGADVQRRFKLGNREIVAPALQDSGDIDLYPEYVGSYTTFLDRDATVPSDVDEAVEQLRRLAGEVGVVLGEPAPAEDKNGFVVTRAIAEQYGLRTVSDLASVEAELSLGGPPECPQRPYCAIGLQDVYGVTVRA